MSIMIEFLVIILMLVLNAFFAAFEMALASVSRARLAVLFGKKVRGAEAALFMKDNIEASLAVVQLGITLSTAVAAATGGLGASDSFSPWLVSQLQINDGLADIIAVIIWVVPLSGVTIIFSELLPKLLALKNRERVCVLLSPVMQALYHAFTPVVRILERTVKVLVPIFSKRSESSGELELQGLHDLQAATAFARTARLIGAHQEKIVLSAAQLSARSVKDIIIPISEVSTIPLSSSLSQALIIAHMDMHTRFPVCAREGDYQSIEGYVNFKDIISALRLNPSDPSIRGIVRPIRTVPAGSYISQALEIMILEKLHIMLVTKNSQVIGIVTLEDIIEELVGEIEDEYDRLPNHIHPFAGGWIIGGGVSMNVVFQTTGVSVLGLEMQERLADWCSRHSAGELQAGEVIEAEGIRVVPRKFRRHKVSEAAIAALPVDSN